MSLSPIRIHEDELVERVAQRVLELLRGEHVDNVALLRPLTALEVAKMIGYSRDFVYEHRDELGVLPATGRRPRLLFDPQRVRAWLTAPERHHKAIDKRNREAINAPLYLGVDLAAGVPSD